MDTNSTLNYRLYLQRQEEFVRADYRAEFRQYNKIKNGDVEGVRERFKIARLKFQDGRGNLSYDPVRSMVYHLVTAVAVISRMCIDAGMEMDTAYTLGDIYIRRADQAKDVEEVLDITAEMQIDYATRMKELKKVDAVSIHIRRSIDYIYDNLQRPLTVNELAEREGLSAGYYSRLFMKEMGVNVNQFINNAKIRTAENMLRYSDYPILDIAISLGYSSQSAFSSVFKKITGMTPKSYRDKFYNKNIT
ncbi:MAG: AraC family transcriptional regulator [Eubacterium sp.]|nr:AraC family transcriptional regulator [Eubacterium sp.]